MDELLDDPIDVPISAIEHYSYCPRQCALIHVEQTFDEQLGTLRGRLAHDRVHGGEEDSTGGVRSVRGIPLWSERHGLRGKADLVELRSDGPYPIEYKVGRRLGVHADLQLCAQALCLEEMLGVSVPRGAIFYHATRHRHEVVLDDALRARTIQVVASIRGDLREQRLPDAPNDARCPSCSLVHACLPSVIGERARLRGLQGALFHAWPVSADDA